MRRDVVGIEKIRFDNIEIISFEDSISKEKLSEIENGTSNLKIEDFTGETTLEDVTVLVGNGAKIVSTKLSSNLLFFLLPFSSPLIHYSTMKK